MGVIIENWAVEQFKKWRSKDISNLVSNYEPQKDYLIIDVFQLKEPKESKIIIPENIGQTESQLGIMWTTIAKVLKSSHEMYPDGCYIKLHDYKAAVMTGIDYEQWQAFPKNGTIKPIGKEPPKIVCRFNESFLRYMFNPAPIPGIKEVPNTIFSIPAHEVQAKIIKIDDLLN